ncbi:hypothetical protein LSCM1_03770 [Leishmania martiniquensis]|uniref:Pseudouridine synthase RsuA/RluA-like domain-containing protein n=1 Tax=Leishmania martiniquensis TaxID=1580590 RepID=A0A836KFR1_9TRYP|nr:hypothetical protein LSCM1_03770 [Leishmania martiniquensis]
MNGKDGAPPPAPCGTLDVIYENEEVLVVSKPPDMPMDGDEAVYGRTIESLAYAHMKASGIFDEAHEQLRQEKKRKKQLKFVHQLDFSTSGVLCLAFTRDMAARLAHCFEMRTARKYYVALLHGHVPGDVMPPKDGASRGELGPTSASETGLRRSPFVMWADACHNAWKGVGCIEAVCTGRRYGDAPASSVAEDELAVFRQLLRGPHEAVLEANAQVDAKGASGGESAIVVHRFRSGRSASPSPATSAPEQSSPLSADAVEDLIHRTLSEKTASPSILLVRLPVGYDLTDPRHFRMAVTSEHGRDATTSLLVLKRTYLAETPPAEGEPPPRDAIASDLASARRYPVTLVLLAPHTGRRHQLRVHCRAIGVPILGDTLYSCELPWCADSLLGPSALAWGAAGARRMYLHAWRLLLPGALTRCLDDAERVALKKKRRRETLGLSDAGDASVPASCCEWTEFVASVDFSELCVQDAEDWEGQVVH